MSASRKTRSRVACLLVACLLPACTRANATSNERPPIPIKVERVGQHEQVAPARFSASIEPAVRVTLAFRVGGYVESLAQVGPSGARRALDKGDLVKQGTLLARVRQDDYAHKVASARAHTAEATSQEKLAKLELERAGRLLESKSITKAEYDAKLASAEYAEANSEAARARVAEAEVALGDTRLRAPMDGVILSRSAELGALVAPGQEAFTLADVTRVKAVFGAPQSVVQSLSIGSPAYVYVDPEPDSARSPERRTAQVSRIAPSADALGRVFSVEVELRNDDGRLRAGSVVSVHLPNLDIAHAPLSVPLASVVRAPHKPHAFAVFVLDGNGQRGPVHAREVQLAEVLANSVTVASGLHDGERVVTLGSTLLRDGDDAVVIR